MLLLFVLHVLSIGISDSIELIHQFHNYPDIMKKKWIEYTYFDAFMSGIYCSFPIIFEYIVFLGLGIQPFFLNYPHIEPNFLLLQYINPFLSHTIIYILGLIHFFITIYIWPRYLIH